MTIKGLDKHITAIPADRVDMEKFSCECDINCPEQVLEKDLVQCEYCGKYISKECIITHLTECQEN